MTGWRSLGQHDPNGRFSRQQAVEGWQQHRLSQARVLVVGAGALGNELLKNLALLGVGTLGIIDFDRVERSNLPRCVLFRASDVGQPKAEVAAARLAELAPDVETRPIAADLLTEVGAGLFEEFDLVLGAVDSVAARWQLNRFARRSGLSWIDAGVAAYCGQVARFDPGASACFECGMTDAMWRQIFERHSCSGAARNDVVRAPVAVALPIVSLTAAIQAQEAVSFLMPEAWEGQDERGPLRPGERLSFSLNTYQTHRLGGRRRASCLAHAGESMKAAPTPFPHHVTASEFLSHAEAKLLDLEWDVVHVPPCLHCGCGEEVFPLWKAGEDLRLCGRCRAALPVEQTNTIQRGSRLAAFPLSKLGVPPKAHLRTIPDVGAEPRWYKLA